MKQYIKPQTEVQIIMMTQMVCESVRVDNDPEVVSGGDTKSRDVWKDGFWD